MKNKKIFIIALTLSLIISLVNSYINQAIAEDDSGDASATNVNSEVSINANANDTAAIRVNHVKDVSGYIAYWWGKVNKYKTVQGDWTTDPDGVSGANINKLVYCKKWFPGATEIEIGPKEFITDWKDRGLHNSYDLAVDTYKCVKKTEVADDSSAVLDAGEDMGPDLIVSSIEVITDSQSPSSSQVAFKITIKNKNGSLPATIANSYLNNNWLNGYSTSGTANREESWNIADVPADFLNRGENVIKVVVDANNTIAETNEDNNISSRTFQIKSETPISTEIEQPVEVTEIQPMIDPVATEKESFNITNNYATTDTLGFIAYWWGKVNKYRQDGGKWENDPDGVSGANIEMTVYCQKWFPETKSVIYSHKEFITDWKERGLKNSYDLERPVYRCSSKEELTDVDGASQPTAEVIAEAEEIKPDQQVTKQEKIKNIFRHVKDIKTYNQPQVIDKTIESVKQNGEEKFLYIIRGENFGETGDIKIGETWLNQEVLFRSDNLIIVLSNNSLGDKVVVTRVKNELELTDGDNDGLPDEWETVLGTDSKIADSDNDGYSDGQEVKHQYDPLKKLKKFIDVDLSNIQ